jgi:hypothetical protein
MDIVLTILTLGMVAVAFACLPLLLLPSLRWSPVPRYEPSGEEALIDLMQSLAELVARERRAAARQAW